MKERSKERKERKVVVVAEEKNEKEKATTTSRAGRAHEECPLNVVTQEDIERFIDIINETMIRTSAVVLPAHGPPVNTIRLISFISFYFIVMVPLPMMLQR